MRFDRLSELRITRYQKTFYAASGLDEVSAEYLVIIVNACSEC